MQAGAQLVEASLTTQLEYTIVSDEFNSVHAENTFAHSLKVTEVLNVVLHPQLYVPPSVVWKRENWRMVSVELLITNTLDEVSVLVMVTEPFFQTAGVVLQERVSDWPTVASWLPPLTSTPPMVTTGPAALQSATVMTKGNVAVGCCSVERLSLHRSNHLVASCYNYNEATGQAS